METPGTRRASPSFLWGQCACGKLIRKELEIMDADSVRVSNKADRFVESVIREMTRQAIRHSAVNLAQGFPDFPAPNAVKLAAQQVVAADINQYAITWVRRTCGGPSRGSFTRGRRSRSTRCARSPFAADRPKP